MKCAGEKKKIEHGTELNLNEVIWLNYLMKDNVAKESLFLISHYKMTVFKSILKKIEEKSLY